MSCTPQDFPTGLIIGALGACLCMGVIAAAVASLPFLTALGRAKWRHNRVVARRVTEYINLGFIPETATRIVHQELERDALETMKLVQAKRAKKGTVPDFSLL